MALCTSPVAVPKEKSSEHLREVHDRICHFEHPEQLFGDLGPTAESQAAMLSQAYKFLIKLYHPDLFSTNRQASLYADNITKTVNALRMAADKKIAGGTYGKPVEMEAGKAECVITTARREYRVLEYFREGEWCDLYLAEYDDPHDRVAPIKQVVIKTVKAAEDNHLIINEALVHDHVTHQSLPRLEDQFIFPEEGKKALILKRIDGITLEEVRALYPSGIEARNMVWILERLLSVLGYMHYHGVLHGNIHPGNIMVRARDHNAFLVDFTRSIINPGACDSFEEIHRDYTAPEVRHRTRPHPASDLFALGRSMVYLLGGDPRDEAVPDHVDSRINEFLGEFLLKNPAGRANDAWKMYHRLSNLRKEVFGARHEYYPFNIEAAH
ncbi:MAG: hypothetical protein RDV48_00715 [Candidatus Eremiobacteraeota bacterium]|nr:hypothetical protein [Candidatus Eremiobacteraeota bacterium]